MGNPNPTVDESGNVYIGSGTGNIYKISSACELNWVYNNSDNELLPSSVFIGDTGSCFFTADGKLHHLIGQTETTAVYNKNRSDNGNTNLYYTIDISGTKNLPHQFEVQIFPNPAEDHLVLTWKDSSESMTLFLYDIQGKLVYENQVINGEPVLLNQLNSGIYIVQLFNAKEFIYSEKIVLH